MTAIPEAIEAPLVRYGATHSGPYLLTEMSDGYWTPWFVAEAELAARGIEAFQQRQLAERYKSQVSNWIAISDKNEARAEAAEARADRLERALEAIKSKAGNNVDTYQPADPGFGGIYAIARAALTTKENDG